MKQPVLVTLFLLLIGCETDSQKEERQNVSAMQQQAWDTCLDNGGVPIPSGWSLPPHMSTCVFPPAEK